MKRLILISGKQGSGKTTLAKQLAESLKEAGHQVATIKFADVLYELHDLVWWAMRAYGERLETVKDGPLLQVLGTEWGRKTRGQDIWVRIAKRRAEKAVANGAVVVIDDCRFPNELEAFPEAYSIRLECSSAVRRERCEAWRDNERHESETALDGSLDKFTKVIDTEHLDAGSVLETVLEGISK